MESFKNVVKYLFRYFPYQISARKKENRLQLKRVLVRHFSIRTRQLTILSRWLISQINLRKYLTAVKF